MVNVLRIDAQLDAIDGSYFDGIPGYPSGTSDNNRRAAKLATLLQTIVGQDGMGGATAYGVGDYGYITKVGPAASALALAVVPDTQSQALYNQFFQAVDAELKALGGVNYSDLKTYLAYQNTLSAYSGLIGPKCAYLWWLYKSGGLKTPATLLAAGNVFAPQTTFANATIGAAGAVTAGLTGSVIKTANDTSGTPQGYVPAPGLLATATVTVSGSELLSVTYSGQTGAGVPFTGHVGTLDVGSLAAGGTTPGGNWTPAAAGERVSAVTAITVTGSPTATSGAVTVVSQLERITS